MTIRDGVGALTEREKETLRLLLTGHDAKSIARHFGLSIHTVNERLRDARRKLGVSSSREAARVLAEGERDPDSLGDKGFGVAIDHSGAATTPGAKEPRRTPNGFTWLAGGMLVMSLIVVALALLARSHSSDSAQAPANMMVAASAGQVSAAGEKSAVEWMTLLDQKQWEKSWASAGSLFKSKITAPTWATKVQSVRQPLGAVSSRKLQNVQTSTTLPGAPDGEYEILQFETSFAARKGVETVVLAHEASGWRVDGYFIR